MRHFVYLTLILTALFRSAVSLAVEPASHGTTTLWHPAIPEEVIRVERTKEANTLYYQFVVYDVQDSKLIGIQEVLGDAPHALGFTARELRAFEEEQRDLARLACNWVTGVATAGLSCLAAAGPYMRAEIIRRVLRHPTRIKIQGKSAEDYFDLKDRFRAALSR